MFGAVVVASLCRIVGSRMSRRGRSFGRPGSQPQVIDGRSGVSLSSEHALKRKVNSIPRLLSGGIGTLMFSVGVSLTSSYGARIEAKGLMREIGTLMFSVVVASLRGTVGCVSRWWSPFTSRVPANRRESSFNHVTPVFDAGDFAHGRAVEGAEALRRRTSVHWGKWLKGVARRRGRPVKDLHDIKFRSRRDDLLGCC